MKRVGYGLLGMLLVAAVAVVLVYAALFVPTRRFEPSRQVSIRQGESLTTAARELARTGVIRSEIAFVVYAEMTGKARRIKPGDYAFAGSENTPAVLEHLVKGDFIVITVTIPEGMTLHQIGQRIGEAGLLCDYTFDAAATVGMIPRALGLGSLGSEGFLFPATYRFGPHATPDQVVAAMLARFYEILTPEVEKRLFELGLTARQMVTMASIVEKEAQVRGERPLIAGVFYNRMRLGMPLQSDPTAQYDASGDVGHAVTAVRMPSAYNTYSIVGLPPGPIANPGLSSILAALYPDHTDYLYFVARSDGTHVFSRSFEDHQRAIAELRNAAAHASAPPG
ncbi:MAG TPA: endolytic transglycosylase MltG [Candidatus Binataceae bacterium]|nr:endolytic transglycosylase MltG [Candidatus Binataceae bacterium]